MFGRQKVDPLGVHLSRWDIYSNPSSLKDTFNDVEFSYSELFAGFKDGEVTFWYQNHYLTTLSMSERAYKSLVRDFGLNTTADVVELEISNVMKARNGTDFFFIGGSLQTIQHAFSAEQINTIDDDEGLQILHDGKKIAVFKDEVAEQFKQALTSANQIAKIKVSEQTRVEWQKIKEQQQLAADIAAKEVAEKERYESQERAGFPEIILTTESPSPFPVSERLGIISAEYAHRTKLLAGAFAEISSIGKDRNRSTENALKKAKEFALLDLKRQAYELEADAVVAVDFDYSEIGGAGDPMLFLVVNGTAIKIQK